MIKVKLNKLNLLIYIYTGKLTTILYYLAVLIIIIPVSIVLVTDTTFSSSFSKIILGTAGAFIIIENKILRNIDKVYLDVYKIDFNEDIKSSMDRIFSE